MVFGPFFPSSGLPNSVISKGLQPSIRLSLPLLSCPFPSRLPNDATGLRGSLVHVSPRFGILQTVELRQTFRTLWCLLLLDTLHGPGLLGGDFLPKHSWVGSL